jgi:predicted homoserine dehydrogenase-like protein
MTIARAALFNDAATAPLGGPVVEVLAAAKTPLAKGTKLDGIGGYHVYGMAENSNQFRADSCVPMSLVEGCELTREVNKDEVITLDHITFPTERLADKLRQEQDAYFSASLQS